MSLASSDFQLLGVQWAITLRLGSSSTTDSCRSDTVLLGALNPLPVETNTWPAESTGGAPPEPQMAPPCSFAPGATSNEVWPAGLFWAAETSQP